MIGYTIANSVFGIVLIHFFFYKFTDKLPGSMSQKPSHVQLQATNKPAQQGTIKYKLIIINETNVVCLMSNNNKNPQLRVHSKFCEDDYIDNAIAGLYNIIISFLLCTPVLFKAAL